MTRSDIGRAIRRGCALILTPIITGMLTICLVDSLGWPLNRGMLNITLSIIGAGVGFWFAYTGRLARLFRKVG
jgi:uncharacterized membrane protein